VKLHEAKEFINKLCEVRWLDRSGTEQSCVSLIYDVTFVPLYGGYVVTDADDIRLDKIIEISAAESTAPVAAVYSEAMKIAA
jgi:hypothetical protein